MFFRRHRFGHENLPSWFWRKQQHCLVGTLKNGLLYSPHTWESHIYNKKTRVLVTAYLEVVTVVNNIDHMIFSCHKATYTYQGISWVLPIYIYIYIQNKSTRWWLNQPLWNICSSHSYPHIRCKIYLLLKNLPNGETWWFTIMVESVKNHHKNKSKLTRNLWVERKPGFLT